MNKSSFIDTDIIIKIGGYNREKLLRKILMSFEYELFIHEYLVNEELIFGGYALEQLDEMIKSKEIIVMKESDLLINELQEYKGALNLLASVMNVDLTKKRDKNAGEIKSMAMAFAKNFEYFISDDGDARVVAKNNLQKIDGTCLNTIRMKDIIKHIRENSKELFIDRKTAKNLFLFGTSPKLARNTMEEKKLSTIRDFLKTDFDNNLWPIK